MRLIITLSLIILTACSSGNGSNKPSSILKPYAFKSQKISVMPFLLTSYERINLKYGVANVYIEGDGFAWINKSRPSLDPTPKNPVALKLAVLDEAKNVIYLARPCQYTKTVSGAPCPQKYWTSYRFSSEVIGVMSKALDDIKKRHKIVAFNLIGFSGGGNIAALLAERRDDVLSLRTVGGNLNHQLHSKIHNVSEMPQSLNALNIAHRLHYVPQLHFIGGADQVVPLEIYNSYKKSSGNHPCVQSYIVESASHNFGWDTVWRDLLKLKFSHCK
jgi:hypothetical protein